MRRILVLTMLVAASDCQAQGMKIVRDWLAGCDNTRHCTAVGMSSPDAAAFAALHFERGPAGSDGIPEITLQLDADTDLRGDWTLEVDGSPLSGPAAEGLRADGESGGTLQLRHPDAIAALLDALRRANTLAVRGPSGVVGSVSLSGASAVLLWIDEQQGRLGTSTALVRRGERDPARMAEAPSPPRVQPSPDGIIALAADESAEPVARVRASVDEEDCEALRPDGPGEDDAWALPGGRHLVSLTCFIGAYNIGSRWFLLEAGLPPRLLDFAAAGADGRFEPVNDLINAGFDPASGVLGSFSKGRGLGDCGSHGKWAWDGQRFVLQHFRLMPECRGVEPELWPVLWRSR